MTTNDHQDDKALLYFDFFHVGKKLHSAPYTVHKEEIIAFAKQWDPQPFHINETAAKKIGFKDVTACSAHVFSIFCIASQNVKEGYRAHAIAALGFDELRMLKPIFAGDTLTSIGVVEEARLSKSNPAQGVVSIRSELFNQHNEPVFSIRNGFLIHCR